MYEQVCEEYGWTKDTALVQQMRATNEVKLKELDGKIEDAEKNLGETEVRDFMLDKALQLTKIGAKVIEIISASGLISERIGKLISRLARLY